MNPKTHQLKTWPVMFQPTLDGDKPFEARFNDRGFQRGDLLHLREWDPDTKTYTGREALRLISYVLSGWGVQAGHVVLGLRDLEAVADAAGRGFPIPPENEIWVAR